MHSSRDLSRALLVINRLAYGGAENQLVHLARGLADLGHEVTICSIGTSHRDLEPLSSAGVSFVCLGAEGRMRRALAVPRLARLARGADVVHCTGWDASLWGRLAAILAHRPVIVADHATDRSVQVASSGAKRATWIAWHNRILERFTFATAACSSSQVSLLTSEGVRRERIVHIPNGIPIAEITALAKRAPARDDLGLSAEDKVVIHVAVFRPEKNHLELIKAMAAIREQIPNLKLLLVGDGSLRPEIEEMMATLEGNWMHLLGFRDDVPVLMSLADLMVLPSISDAMPMTIIEAMAVGLPVVATDVGDIKATLAAGGGITVPQGDMSAFRQACIRVLSDDGVRSALADEGRAGAIRFDAIKMASRTSSLIEAAAKRDPSALSAAPGVTGPGS